MITRLILFRDPSDVMGNCFRPGGEGIIVGLGIRDLSLQHGSRSRDMAKGGELAFRLDILTDLKFGLRVTPFSDMATIAVLIGLGVADIAGEFVTVDIVGEEV